MLTVNEAARLLNVSPTRVRVMAASKVLAGEKVGNRWFIYEAAVEQRLENGVRPGPKKLLLPMAYEGDVLQAHELYTQCKVVFERGTDPVFLGELKDSDEREFAIYLANFFMAKKQKSLIEQGVY